MGHGARTQNPEVLSSPENLWRLSRSVHPALGFRQARFPRCGHGTLREMPEGQTVCNLWSASWRVLLFHRRGAVIKNRHFMEPIDGRTKSNTSITWVARSQERHMC